MSTEQRLIEIESKMSHQEFLIEKLNQVIYQHEQSISKLEGQLAVLLKILPDVTSRDFPIGPGDEKPPHY